jgi:chromosome segregation and condensation protein ScpB
MEATGLWDAVKSTATKAQKEGSLFTIKTTPEFLQNFGIKVIILA